MVRSMNKKADDMKKAYRRELECYGFNMNSWGQIVHRQSKKVVARLSHISGISMSENYPSSLVKYITVKIYGL